MPVDRTPGYEVWPAAVRTDRMKVATNA